MFLLCSIPDRMKNEENALLKNEADTNRILVHYTINLEKVANHSVYNSARSGIVTEFTAYNESRSKFSDARILSSQNNFFFVTREKQILNINAQI